MGKRRKPELLAGRAVEELVQRGTASEHAAVVLRTEDGERVVLQRIGGNPFDDEETRALIGRDVRVEGFRIGRIFRYRKATPCRGRSDEEERR
jgi:hypothetical protein